MNETMLMELTKTESDRASELHGKVLAAREQVADALCTFAMHLKAMRDGKLYLALGYDSFDSYVENGVEIAKRQVYNYISTYERLGSDVMQSNAQLGITKLQLISEVPWFEREEFIDENDLASMSTAQIKELVKQINQKSEQISFLQEQVDKSEDTADSADAVSELEKERDKLLARIEEMENQPIEVAVAEPTQADLDVIRKEIEDSIKEKLEKSKSKAVQKAQDKAEVEYQTKLKTETERVAKETEEKYKSTIENIQNEMQSTKEKAAQATKLSEVSGDADMVTASFYVSSVQDYFGKLIELIDAVKATDPQKADKLTGAAGKLIDILSGYINVK